MREGASAVEDFPLRGVRRGAYIQCLLDRKQAVVSFGRRAFLGVVVGGGATSGFDSALAVVDPVSQIVTSVVAEHAFRATKAGFDAAISGVQFLESVIRLTRTFAGLSNGASPGELAAVSAEIGQLRADLSRVAGQILEAIDNAPQENLYRLAYSASRMVSVRSAGLAASSPAEQARIQEELREARVRVEDLVNQMDAMRRTTERPGIHYVSALHALATTIGQLQMARAGWPERDAFARRALTSMREALDGSLEGATAPSSFMVRSYRSALNDYQVAFSRIEQDAQYSRLLQAAKRDTTRRFACFEKSETYTHWSVETRRPAIAITREGIDLSRTPRQVNVAESRTRVIRDAYGFAIPSFDAGVLLLLGPLEPRPEAVPSSQPEHRDSACYEMSGASGEQWRSLAVGFNEQVSQMVPHGSRAAILHRTIDLAGDTRRLIAHLKPHA